MAKEIASVFVFASDSSPGKNYQTLQYTDGTTSCDCKGWTFKRKTANGERTCKHTRLVDMGMGEQSCVRSVNYLPVVAQPRRAHAPSLKQQSLTAKRGRVLYLDQV